MATLKAEFLSHYQDIHGVPLRSRLFGAIRTLNRLGAATAPLSNLPARVRRCARCSSARPASTGGGRCRASRARRWCAGTGAARRRRGRPTAARSCSSPTPSPPTPSRRVGRAAIELLEAAGWRVRLERAGCCGRASISKGLLDQARGMAADMVGRLAP